MFVEDAKAGQKVRRVVGHTVRPFEDETVTVKEYLNGGYFKLEEYPEIYHIADFLPVSTPAPVPHVEVEAVDKTLVNLLKALMEIKKWNDSHPKALRISVEAHEKIEGTLFMIGNFDAIKPSDIYQRILDIEGEEVEEAQLDLLMQIIQERRMKRFTR